MTYFTANSDPKYKILVVEDDEMLREALIEAAKGKQMKVVTSIDGTDAWMKARNQSFHGIIIDMNIPKRLGHEVVKMIRDDGPNKETIIIVLSGYLKKEVVEALAGKIEKAFTKPADIEKVMEALLQMIEKRNSGKS